ncbi:DUF4350 domain-containing protein [Micromonospora sp. NBC_01813]|uniref:DUF4350 domain-containing protein n=1 Tax=Micromonospora sp. NBC_01813 TaxID=2975988 RepID=UPI002DDBCCAB|nr:DUF4350 domain-containing protein [Micromonospora sp. NBC_01813]WSA08450.1 DUF4350 domain-containing protein [Micromonospora sp. NBC_01813]
MVTRVRRRWRPLRIIVPFVVAAALLAGTLVAYQLEHPDPTRPGFLSPTNTAPDGASRLAAALRDQNLNVRTARRTAEAISAAQAGPTTLFIPAPTLVHPDYLQVLARLPVGSRVVMIDPPARLLHGDPVPIGRGVRRWAAKASGPDLDGRPCALPEVASTGPAAALRQRYVAPTGVDPDRVDRCYDAGLARLAWGQTELVVVGASDPFRNGRFAEHRNADFATGLLGTRPTVVWLDLARPDTPPTQPGQPTAPWLPEAEPSTADASPEAGPGQTPTPGRPTTADAGNAGNPLLDAFPAWFWALLVQLALAVLALAFWRSRRLGPPVTEPLPVRVAAAETVLGRGRLYRRVRGREPTANAVRTATLARLVPLLALTRRPTPADVVAAVARHTGQPPEPIDALLYGPPPTTDADLLELGRRLAALHDAVAGPPAGPVDPVGSPDPPAPPDPPTPPNPPGPGGGRGPGTPAPRAPSDSEGEQR